MNRDEILRFARESGLHLPYWDEDEDPKKDPPRWGMASPLPPLLERFAALIEDHITWSSIHTCSPGCTKPACVAVRKAVEAEREACAKVCDERFGVERIAQECAAAIRSRT